MVGLGVYKWVYCWVKKNNYCPYLPYFSVARYANTTFFGLSGGKDEAGRNKP